MITRSKFLEPAELLELRNKLTYTNRDHVMIRFALETGARASEILNLRQTDLYRDTNTVFIKTLKKGIPREIPVTSELMQALVVFIPFNINYRRLDQVWQKYKPCDKPFHSLRHTFAVNLYRRTRDLKLVQLALGHARVTTTAIYQDFCYSREEMARILEIPPTV